jgi:hypothetical protein
LGDRVVGAVAYGGIQLATLGLTAVVGAVSLAVVRNRREAEQKELARIKADRELMQNIVEQPPAEPIRRTKRASKGSEEEPLRRAPRSPPFRPSTLEPTEQ